MICVVYVTYMQSIQYHVFGTFWYTCKVLIRCSKIWQYFLKIWKWNKFVINILDMIFLNLVIEILLIVLAIYNFW